MDLWVMSLFDSSTYYKRRDAYVNSARVVNVSKPLGMVHCIM